MLVLDSLIFGRISEKSQELW